MSNAEWFAMRMKNAALRLARLVEMNAPPLVIATEKALVDKFYSEWERRALTTHEAPRKVQ